MNDRSISFFREHWRWFKVLRLNRCRRPHCWKPTGFNQPGYCDAHHRAVWTHPDVVTWLGNLSQKGDT